jgi:hypothetical protein
MNITDLMPISSYHSCEIIQKGEYAMLVRVGVIAWALAWFMGCGSRSHRDDDQYGTPFAVLGAMKLAEQAPNVNMGLSSYTNCEELRADIQSSLDQQTIMVKANLAASIQQQLNWMRRPLSNGNRQEDTAQADSAGSGTESMTNVQERGVDEADFFRVGQDQIFAASFDRIHVIDRPSLKPIGSVALQFRSRPLLFTKENKLIVIETDSIKTSLRIFRTRAGTMPALERTWSVTGRYVDSRLVESQIILVMNDELPQQQESFAWDEFANETWYQDKEAQKLFAQYSRYYVRRTLMPAIDGRISGVPCTAISQRKVADFDFRLAKILSLNIDDSQASEKAVASIGQGSQIYVTSDAIYLVKSGWDWFSSSYFSVYNYYGGPEERVYIRQASFNAQDGALAMEAEGEVEGRIKDRWALRGLNGGQNLVITTSTGLLWSNANIAQNHLFILEKDPGCRCLKIKGGIKNFGTHEDIRAVRYIGDKVYVVTFKKTDPLFAFDISNLSDPKLLSGLKIPGFSTYLHPLADGRMFGLGFDADDQGSFAFYRGIQASLFDISNPLDMARIDNHIFGNRGSSSEATSNHHAFFYDTESGLIGFPLVELAGDSLKGEMPRRVFSGAVLLGFNGKQLVEQGRISHGEWIQSGCHLDNYGQWWQNQTASLDVNRVYRVDNRLVSLSPLGLKAHALNDFGKPLIAERFESGAIPCSPRPPLAD